MTEIFIDEEITVHTGIRIANRLKNARIQNIHVSINSPGGDVDVGRRIYRLLKMQKVPITVDILGLAASSATIISLAGNHVCMASDALVMIHNPTVRPYDPVVAAETTDWLVAFYKMNTGAPASMIRAMMRDETWFAAHEAISAGLSDEIIPPSGLIPPAEYDRYRNQPNHLAFTYGLPHIRSSKRAVLQRDK